MYISFLKKAFLILIILLLVGTEIASSTQETFGGKKTISPIDEPGFIQGLIDNATNGDTIYIPSGIYYESLNINKSITLLGENKNTTIIDGSEFERAISVVSNWVNISGFTIRTSVENPSQLTGVSITYSDHNNISGNIIKNNDIGICLDGANNNSIYRNIFSKNGNGLKLLSSRYNNIISNIISKNKLGIHLLNSRGWIAYRDDSSKNTISKNNFLENILHAFFSYVYYKLEDSPHNLWNHNYWNRPHQYPKFIVGIKVNSFPLSIFPFTPRINIDWEPALTPYEIR
jgi:parallel beta-helix repeat protein